MDSLPCKTCIGYIRYYPKPPASAVDYNTVHTMMKKFQAMFHSLGQQWTMVTYDEAICSKAQIIKWRTPEEFAHNNLEMGSMPHAVNYMDKSF